MLGSWLLWDVDRRHRYVDDFVDTGVYIHVDINKDIDYIDMLPYGKVSGIFKKRCCTIQEFLQEECTFPINRNNPPPAPAPHTQCTQTTRIFKICIWFLWQMIWFPLLSPIAIQNNSSEARGYLLGQVVGELGQPLSCCFAQVDRETIWMLQKMAYLGTEEAT